MNYCPEEKLFVGCAVEFPFHCDIQEVGEEGFIYRSHWHSHLEILYVFQGTLLMMMEGERFCASEGELIFINAHKVHSVAVKRGSSARYLVIRCIPDIMYNAGVMESRYQSDFIAECPFFDSHFDNERIRRTYIPDIMQQLCFEYRRKAYGYKLVIRSDMLRLFLWFLRERRTNKALDFSATSKKSLNRRYTEQFESMLEYVRQHYNEPISPNMAAAMCNMSYSHFCRVFKQLVGKTFSEHIHCLRITEAEKRLLTSNQSITQIAYLCGFSHPSYFSKQFKAYRGVSPQRLRRLLLSDEGPQQE
ncbi:AraC family transcriptional regulator [Paenibacillus sp. HB172176]|uniref:helix-turn-helix transcriptional regulator n=1 Tax=Paenibacillus sp. HB172176 TaxID=2493690 RepID=UPI00143C8F1C|nr:AraC family transcriptional regulator [Paenibacillus sp. HB172176]